MSNTIVSGTVYDAAGTVMANAVVSAQFVGDPLSNVSGANFPRTITPVMCDTQGRFSVTVTDNTSVLPVGSRWRFQFCPPATDPQCYQFLLTISGATQDITAQIQIPAVIVNPVNMPRAYLSSEINGPRKGSFYWDLNFGYALVYDGTNWNPFGGSATALGGIATINGDNTANQLISSGSSSIQIAQGSPGTTLVKSTANVGSINGDATVNQTIQGSAGISVTTAAGVTTISGPTATNVVTSINGDTAAAQHLVAGTGITITDTGSGNHTIAVTAGFTFSAAGDLSGTSTLQTVIGLQGKGLDAATIGAPTDGQVVTYSSASGKYIAKTPAAPVTTIPISSLTAGVGANTFTSGGYVQTWQWAWSGINGYGLILSDISGTGSGYGRLLQLNGQAYNTIPLEAIHSAGSSEIHFGAASASGNTATGGWLTSTAGAEARVSACTRNINGSWYAGTTSAAMLVLNDNSLAGGGFGFYGNANLTAGNTFTPQMQEAIYPYSGGNGHTFYYIGSPVGALNSTSGGLGMTSGATPSASGWTAQLTSASSLSLTNGSFYFYGNTGLTVGNIITWSQVAIIDGTNGIRIFDPGSGNWVGLFVPAGYPQISTANGVLNIYNTSVRIEGGANSDLRVFSPDNGTSLKLSCVNAGSPALTSSAGSVNLNFPGGSGVNNWLSFSVPSVCSMSVGCQTISGTSYGYIWVSTNNFLFQGCSVTLQNSLFWWSPDNTRYGQLSCANAGDPTILSSTITINHTGAGNVTNVRITTGNAIFTAAGVCNFVSCAYLNGAGQWVASQTGASNMAPTAAGVINFYANTGLTVGNTFAFTQVGYIDSGGYHVGSDYRYKSDVRTLDSALASVMRLRPVSFKWNTDLNRDEDDHLGFIAHEVQSVVPSAVDLVIDALNEDGSIKPQSLNYFELIPLLTRAIQELALRAGLNESARRI
jgi:endosialidase-like protein